MKADTWQGLVNAKNMPKPCVQIPLFRAVMGEHIEPDETVGVEDCLFLNVFTPSICPGHRRTTFPVMVWFHGGGFYLGAAEEYLPHTFLDHDIVLVVVQYRLGYLGFLSTEDSVMPGNLGLKDQTMALEWVQRNVHLFNGDKTRVTIAGESAGGVSVHFHMLLPKSNGLFSQVIMQSGTAIAPWVHQSKHREEAEKLGHKVGCEDVHNSTALLACLQKVNAKELAARVQDTFQWCLFPIKNAPRVDGDFLPDLPAKLMVDKKYSKVNLLAGLTKHDGALLSRVTYGRRELITQLEDHFAVSGPVSLGIEDENDSTTLAKTLYQHYLGVITFDDSHFEQVTQLFTDMHYGLDHDEVSAHHAAHFPDTHTFRYQFDYSGEASMTDVFGTDLGKHTAGHLDDLVYLFTGGPMFDKVFPNGLTNPEDVRVRKIMLKMWVNFITSGNPTPDYSLGFKWERSTANNLHYLSITSSPSMQPDNRKESREFVSSLPLISMKILYPEKHQQQRNAEGTVQEEL